MRIISRQSETRRRASRGRRATPRGGGQASAPARWIAGLALCALASEPAIAQQAATNAKPATPSWYAQAFTRSDEGLSVTYIWSLKSKLRSETVARGHKLVTIVRGNIYYVYDEITRTGVAIRRAPAALALDVPKRRPFGNEAQTLIDEGGEKIREETISGMRADVYQITDDNGRRIVWVTQDDRRLPIRIEIFDRQAQATRVREFVDWVSGIPVTDAFFEPEPNIEFEHFELDAYIAKAIEEGAKFPIFYRELLHGPAPR